ncbi:hypothetical protein KAR91_63890 [Candidatus Pacearchaeota archaeon]|nr:hypothetical protein [Candidatus Pacearchaeota archaeon]
MAAKVRSLLDSPYFKSLSVPLMIAIVVLLWNITTDNKARNERELQMKKGLEKFKITVTERMKDHASKLDDLGNRVTRVETEIKHF